MKKKISANKTAEKLASIAFEKLAKFPEEEQQKRMIMAERTLATVSRAGKRRKSSSIPRTRKTRLSARVR